MPLLRKLLLFASSLLIFILLEHLEYLRTASIDFLPLKIAHLLIFLGDLVIIARSLLGYVRVLVLEIVIESYAQSFAGLLAPLRVILLQTLISVLEQLTNMRQ